MLRYVEIPHRTPRPPDPTGLWLIQLLVQWGMVSGTVFWRTRNAFLAKLGASTLIPLRQVIHAGAQLACDHSPKQHMTAALKYLQWLSVKERIEFKLSRQQTSTYLHQWRLQKDGISAWLSFKQLHQQPWRSDPVIQQTKLKLGKCAFSVTVPHNWNQLPKEITAATDTVAFKRKLKHSQQLTCNNTTNDSMHTLNNHSAGCYVDGNRDTALLLFYYIITQSYPSLLYHSGPKFSILGLELR